MINYKTNKTGDIVG